MWYDESKDYDYSEASFNPDCGKMSNYVIKVCLVLSNKWTTFYIY